MDLILIRHGEPDIEHHEVGDPPLTQLGHRQSHATASFLASTHLDAVYVSPQQRAQQTSVPIVGERRVDPVTDERIAEWDYEHDTYVPPWIHDEMTREQAVERFQAMQTPEFHARVREGMWDIIRDNPGRAVAVVCHGGVIGSLLNDILGADGRFAPHHASITRVSANRRGTRTVISYNEHHWIPTA